MQETYSFSYSIPYIIAALFLIIMVIFEYRSQSDKSKMTIRILCSIFFLIFYGCRGFVAWDWLSYYLFFEEVPTVFSNGQFVLNQVFFSDFDVIEPGFVLYTSIIKSFTSNYHVYIFINSLIDIIVLNIFFKRYSLNYSLSLLTFFALSYNLEFDTLRNIKAILIFLLAVKYIFDKKPIKYFLLILLAITMHRTAIFLIPMYWIGNIVLTKKYIYIFFVIINIFYFFPLPFLSDLMLKIADMLGGGYAEKMNFYLDEPIERGFTIGYIYRFLTFVLIVIFYDRMKTSKQNIFFINLYFVYLLVCLGFAQFKFIVERLDLIFSISYWIIFPMIVEYGPTIRIKRFLINGILILLILKTFQFSRTLMYKYENVLWNKNISYEQRVELTETAREELNEENYGN